MIDTQVPFAEADCQSFRNAHRSSTNSARPGDHWWQPNASISATRVSLCSQRDREAAGRVDQMIARRDLGYDPAIFLRAATCDETSVARKLGGRDWPSRKIANAVSSQEELVGGGGGGGGGCGRRGGGSGGVRCGVGRRDGVGGVLVGGWGLGGGGGGGGGWWVWEGGGGGRGAAFGDGGMAGGMGA